MTSNSGPSPSSICNKVLRGLDDATGDIANSISKANAFFYYYFGAFGNIKLVRENRKYLKMNSVSELI